MLKNLPTRSQLKVGDFVKIEQKHNRNTGHLDEGIIEEILTRGEEHPYGIMVLLTDGKIGRVKEKLEHGPKTTNVDDLLKDQFTGVAEMKVHQKEPVNIEIPKKEDITNEFKETFRFDTKEFKLRNAGQSEAADGRKKEAKKIEAAIKKEVSIAVAAFANQQGGRLFIGVDDDGVVTGLKRDLKLYKNWDEYTRAIIDYIEEFTKNRAHASSIRLKEEENQEYLVLDVPISIHEPIFIHDNKKEEFYVRDATAKSQKFEATDMMRYCNKRFPDWKV
tara:strand:+ start:142 stop:969 length:828 start_codon:yes stop_codon:yes gene_type:complete